MSDAPGKKTILLLDDDKFLLDMYTSKFSNEGYTVVPCLSGTIALTTLRGGVNPDVVVFDITMPELDGIAFLKVIAAEHLAPRAVKIALSNQNEQADQLEVQRLGADRYIVKASMIPSEVVHAVEEELAKRRAV